MSDPALNWAERMIEASDEAGERLRKYHEDLHNDAQEALLLVRYAIDTHKAPMKKEEQRMPDRTLLEQMQDEEKDLSLQLMELTVRLTELRTWLSKEMEFESRRKQRREPLR